MVSDRRFWIMIRIAVCVALVIIGILLYLAGLTFWLPLAGFVTAVSGLILHAVESRYKKHSPY